MGIVTAIVNLCNSFASKRICTVQEFQDACKRASDHASKDADGYINVKEACKILIKSIYAGRMN